MQYEAVFFRVVVRHFLPRLLPAWFAVLLVVSQLDAMTHWPTLRAELQELDPPQVGMLVAFLAGTWSVLAGVALAGVDSRPALRWLLRQPMARERIGGAALLALAPAWPIPLAVAWLFASGLWIAPLAVAVVIIGSALSWFTARREYGATVLVVGLLGLVGCAFAVAPTTSLLFALGSVLLIPLVGVELRRPRSTATVGASGGRVRSGPVTALWRRNGICLLRCHRADVVGTVATGLPVAGLLAAFRFNGGLAGESLWFAFVVLLTIAALPAYAILEELAGTLGAERLLAHRAPIGPGGQLATLLLTAGATLAPAALTLVLIAMPALGPSAALTPVVVAGVLAMVVAALVLRLRFLPRANGMGIFAVLATGATVALARHPVLASLLLLAASLSVAFGLLHRRTWIHARAV